MERYRFKSGPIEEISWGRFVIRGKEHAKLSDGTILGVGKDIRLIGDRLEPWRERKGHRLTKEMLGNLPESEMEVIIIGNGFYGALEVPNEINDFIKSKGKTIIVEKTPRACELFNELFNKGKKVALLAHGTC